MKIYNFSAGPACLPEMVLKAVQEAATDYKGRGMSVMEMSHRSAPIIDLFDEVTSRVRRLLDIPSNYHVLWLLTASRLALLINSIKRTKKTHCIFTEQ